MALLAIAALSARMLAEAAVDDGFEVIALDLFGDADTRRAAAQWHGIGAEGALRLDPQRTLQALGALAGRPGLLGWIPGSGFEADPALLARAAQRLPLIGTASEAFARVRDPAAFFEALARLGIAHPPTRLTGPAPAPGWLLKDALGTGGWHIRRAEPGQPVPEHHYLQREAAGTPMSATFIANGRDARVLGCNLLTVRRKGARPFVYCGAIGPVPVPAALAAAVARATQALVAEFGLRGLCSLDFMRSDDDEVLVLEINPRPSASLALYAGHVPQGLMRAHVQACTLGTLPGDVEERPGVRGTEIVFARHALTLTHAAAAHLADAGDCHDLPSAGSRFDAGDPVCTLGAAGAGAGDVRSQLEARRDALLELLESS